MTSKKPRKAGNRYESSHGATRSLTAAQKLAELACERIACKEGIALIVRFWQASPWAKRYADQIRFANSLLKIYPEEVIFRAFREAERVWSLGAPFFVEYLDKQNALYESEVKRAASAAPIISHDTVATPRTGVRDGRSLRARLNKLDGKKEG